MKLQYYSKIRPGYVPFETIIDMYGLPARGELDPTPWVAPFFFVFFWTLFV